VIFYLSYVMGWLYDGLCRFSDDVKKEGKMKRIIMLGIFLVMMLVSIGGCLPWWWGPDGGGGRGGGHDGGGGHEKGGGHEGRR
jgi:hypothetical protein